jgi:intraflagellar transport protein 172
MHERECGRRVVMGCNLNMHLKYSRNLMPAADGMQKISALAWSPNLMRLAVSTADRIIHLFDDAGERRDRFPTKPAEKGQKSYVVRALAFCPDSTKIAIAQSDNIVFVYKIGTEWGERKAICNKFQQSSAVTCMTWPSNRVNDLAFGLAEGVVKLGQLRNNRASTLYKTDSYVVSIGSSRDGENIVSGHLDGSIYRYNLTSQQFVKLVVHSSIPYALDWGLHIVAAGNDSKVIFYNEDGAVFQRFDYSYDTTVKEFTVAAFNPMGETCVLGNFNRFYVFNYNAKRPEWTEATVKTIPNLYSITGLCWKADGSRLVIGSLCGSVDIFDASMKKALYKGKFEFTYVAPSQVIVKGLASGVKVAVKSDLGAEIKRVNVYLDRFVVANTDNTLILGDMESSKVSEVMWRGSGKERFDFSNPQACMVFNAGEMTLVEYGSNEILGTCRTEQMKSNLISARLNYSRGRGDEPGESTKLIAFLLDAQTIAVQDLNTGTSLLQFSHDSRIDFLELNPSGSKLLFRDKLRQLHLFNVKLQQRCTLLNFCSYVQWVPRSDVVVAQSRQNLNVWYNIDDPDKVTVYSIKGEVVEIERREGKTEVIVNDGLNTQAYALDEPLIEFGFALEQQDLERAVAILEPLENSPEGEANWKALAKVAIEAQNLSVAEHCYAALGDASKARYLHKLNKLAAKHRQDTGQEGTRSYLVQARLSLIEKQFNRAEAILLAQNEVEEAMEMYQELHRWDELISIAEKRNHPKLRDIKATYYDWLLKTNQEEKAAEVKEREGDHVGAVHLYLKGRLPARAAQVLSRHSGSPDLLEKVAQALQDADMHEKAGEFFEKLERPEDALTAYSRGSAYRKAVELARRHFPRMIASLEEQWGDYLVSQRQMETAINHYVEAGATQKAIEAAIYARQWTKALQFLGTQPLEAAKPYYRVIAKHYEELRQLEQAEKLYAKAGAHTDAFEMYTRNNRWDEAYKFARKNMAETEVSMLYIQQANKLESEGKLKEAERMLLTVNEPDLAIDMYKKAEQYDHMLRLVSKHRKELLKDTHLHLAQLLEAEGKLPEAELHLIEAGAWNTAVDLYRRRGMWEDALRVAKGYGGPKEIAEVARSWAEKESSNGEGGSQLLLRQGLVEAALEYEIDRSNFDEAFRLAESQCRHRLPDVHLRYALHLEDESRYKEAEEEFVKAGRGTEAINMYEHQGDFPSALRVARQYDPASVPTILISQGNFFLKRGEVQRAEQAYIAGGKSDLAVKAYVEIGMKNDAVRVAKDHAPHLVNEAMMTAGSSEAALEDVIANARAWEQSREYSKAIDTYLTLTPSLTSNYSVLEECWERAVTLAMTHEKTRRQQVGMQVGQMLLDIRHYEAAAEMFTGIGQYEDAVRCYVEGREFDKAKETAMSLHNTDQARSLLDLIDREQKQFLLGAGPQKAMGVAPREAVHAYIAGGDWEQALENARMKGPEMLNDVLQQYTWKLTEQGSFSDALKAFTTYGAPAEANFMSIYKTLAVEVLVECNDDEVYELRLVLRQLLDGMRDRRSAIYQEFEQLLRICQLCYFKTVTKNKGHHTLYTHICVALLRYTRSVRVDRAFYDAGLACKEEGLLSMAFIFLNRYLDLADAIDDAESAGITLTDDSDFKGTDIPMQDIPLPESNFVSDADREVLREFVLQVSVDQNVDQRLDTTPCENCGREVYVASLNCPHCRCSWDPCLVTGYPVLRNSHVQCSNCGRPANRKDWHTYLTLDSSCPWCSSVQSQAY